MSNISRAKVRHGVAGWVTISPGCEVGYFPATRTSKPQGSNTNPQGAITHFFKPSKLGVKEISPVPSKNSPIARSGDPRQLGDAAHAERVDTLHTPPTNTQQLYFVDDPVTLESSIVEEHGSAAPGRPGASNATTPFPPGSSQRSRKRKVSNVLNTSETDETVGGQDLSSASAGGSSIDKHRSSATAGSSSPCLPATNPPAVPQAPLTNPPGPLPPLLPTPSITLQQLTHACAFQQHTLRVMGREVQQPRLVAYQASAALLPRTYTYSGLTLAPSPFTPPVLQAKRYVEHLAGCTFNSCLLNHYRDGHDHVSWHADNEKQYGSRPTIASFSVGAARDFYLKQRAPPPGGEPEQYRYRLGDGDVLVMRGAVQQHWLHSVPKRTREAGVRISLTFRVVLPAA